MIHHGVSLSHEILQHARTYLKHHLSPVIVSSRTACVCTPIALTGIFYVRKGSHSVRLSERVIFNEKETREIVALFEERNT